MELQKSKKWFYLSLFLMVLSLFVYRVVNPDSSTISLSFFKQNPDFFYEKRGSNVLICRADDLKDEFKALAQNPDLPFKTNTDWIKNDPKRSILTWQISGKRYVIKRYNAKTWSHWVKQLFPYAPSTALRSFYYSYLFDQMGINSAKSVAVIEKRVGPFLSTSYQIMEKIDGLKGEDYFEKTALAEIDYDRSIKKTVEIAQKLENVNLVHKELKLGHFFYVNGTPYLIDLDCVENYSERSVNQGKPLHNWDMLVENFNEHFKKKVIRYSYSEETPSQ
jgi:hypothetical protein